MSDSVPYKKYPILFVDDEEMAIVTFQKLFKNDFTIYTATKGEEAIALLAAHPDIAMVITDQKMPEMTGLDVLICVAQKYPRIINILVTAYSDLALVIKVVNQGNLYRYIAKPYEEEFLKRTIIQGLERYHLLNERDLFFEQHKASLKKKDKEK
ncbi:MAG: response regulator [Nitrospirota bacterium]